MPRSRLVRYLIVGGSAYVIEMAVLYGFRDGIGLSPVKSVAISFWFGLIIAFVLQKYITFENREKRMHILGFQVALYGSLVAVNYLITILAVKYFSKHYSVFEIRTAVIALSTIWNYVVYKRWLFKTKPLELDKS